MLERRRHGLKGHYISSENILFCGVELLQGLLDDNERPEDPEQSSEIEAILPDDCDRTQPTEAQGGTGGGSPEEGSSEGPSHASLAAEEEGLSLGDKDPSESQLEHTQPDGSLPLSDDSLAKGMKESLEKLQVT